MPEQFRLISQAVSADAGSLHIRCPTERGDYKLFWISLLRNRSISIGCFDKNFAVHRLSPDGTLLAGSENSVKKPHVTLHSMGNAFEGFYHLRADGDESVIQGLTWGSQKLGTSTSRWLRWITNPLQTLPTSTATRAGKNSIVWHLNQAPATCSAVLCVDFAEAVFFENKNDIVTSRFIKWGNFLLKIKIAAIDGRDGAVELTTFG